MTPHDIDRLSETFSAHELLASDADSVLARSNEIAQHLRRRRWAVRATGSAFLTAGIVAGAVALPGALHSSSHGRSAVVQELSDNGGAPSSVPSPSSKYTTEQEFTAFFDAGYDYNDAVALAKAWNQEGAQYISKVKAEAGGKLLDGQTLPIAPSGTPTTPQDLKDEADAQAFFDAGYTFEDAQQLANRWNVDTYHAKVDGGKRLENGETLPIQPSGTPAGADQRAVDAYFAAGYDYNDAVRLGQMWHQTDISQVKVEAGQKLENGQQLPIAP